MSAESAYTPDDIELRFETDRLFSEEPPEQSLARADWYCLRQQAEFIAFLSREKVDLRIILGVLQFLAACQEDFGDYISIGLGLDPDEEKEPLRHPQAASFEEHIDRFKNGDSKFTVADFAIAQGLDLGPDFLADAPLEIVSMLDDAVNDLLSDTDRTREILDVMTLTDEAILKEISGYTIPPSEMLE